MTSLAWRAARSTRPSMTRGRITPASRSGRIGGGETRAGHSTLKIHAPCGSCGLVAHGRLLSQPEAGKSVVDPDRLPWSPRVGFANPVADWVLWNRPPDLGLRRGW